MNRISAIVAIITAAACLAVSSVSQAQYGGSMGNGLGMMGPGIGFGTVPGGSAIARGTDYRYGMMAGNYCYGMMGPAVGYGNTMMGPWLAGGYVDPDTAVQTCLSQLHTQLAITSAQEAAWQAFADTLVQQAQEMVQFRQHVLQAPATAPQRVAQYAQFMLERAQDAAAISEAVSALYATLSPTQEALFDEYFAWGM